MYLRYELNQTMDVISYKKQRLSDMPEFLANVILGYDINGFSFRISYFYQGEYPIRSLPVFYQIKEINYRDWILH